MTDNGTCGGSAPIAATEAPPIVWVSSHVASEAVAPPVAGVTPIEALAHTVVAFVSSLAEHLGQTFEETDQLLAATPFNLWPLVDSPVGWKALAALLAPAESAATFPVPTTH